MESRYHPSFIPLSWSLQAVQAMKTYGTKLWIDDAADPASRNNQESKEDSFDFFEEHTSVESKQSKVRGVEFIC